jgi:hypothetical protein
MGRSTLGPKTLAGPANLLPGAAREVIAVTLGGTTTGSKNYNLMRVTSGKIQINRIDWTNHAQMYHAAAEADTWAFDIVNASNGATLNSVAASLSNQTLAATAFKQLLVDNGNSTLKIGETLQLQITASGAPQTLADSMVVIDFDTLSNT